MGHTGKVILRAKRPDTVKKKKKNEVTPTEAKWRPMGDVVWGSAARGAGAPRTPNHRPREPAALWPGGQQEAQRQADQQPLADTSPRAAEA